MDQEDFEEMASIGERPVDGVFLNNVRGASAGRNDNPVHFIVSTPNEPGSFYDLLVNNHVGPVDFQYVEYYGNFPFDDGDDGADSMSGPPSPSTPPTLSGQGYQTDA